MSDEQKMFSQDELDRILKDRLAKERLKYQQEANERAAELDRRERLLTAKADWQKRGLPAELLDSLNLTDEGAIEAAAAVLEGYKPVRGATMTARGGFEGSQGISHTDPEAPLREAFGIKKG